MCHFAPVQEPFSGEVAISYLTPHAALGEFSTPSIYSPLQVNTKLGGSP
jgi:hypothetical protein